MAKCVNLPDEHMSLENAPLGPSTRFLFVPGLSLSWYLECSVVPNLFPYPFHLDSKEWTGNQPTPCLQQSKWCHYMLFGGPQRDSPNLITLNSIFQERRAETKEMNSHLFMLTNSIDPNVHICKSSTFKIEKKHKFPHFWKALFLLEYV